MQEKPDARHISRPSLSPLTSLRFLAALWVVAYHYTLEFRFTSLRQEIGYELGPHNPIDFLLLQGHLAVDFFFLLSGFILAYTYTSTHNSLRGGARGFWVARLARIYPVYLLGLALSMWTVLGGRFNPLDVITSITAHIFLVHAWFPTLLDLNQPSWSLSVEAFFYALFPLLLPLFARRSLRGVRALFLGSLLVFAMLILAMFVASSQPSIASLPGWRTISRYNPLLSLPEFTAGMALGLLFIRRGERTTLSRKPSGLRMDLVAIAVTIGLCAVLIGIYKLHIPTYLVDTEAPFALPFLAALVYALAIQRGLIVSLLSRPVMVWLGEISYGIYIVHVPVWDIVRQVAAKFGIPPGSVILIPLYAALVLTVAGLSFTYIERPARRAIRSRWGAHKAVAVPITA